MAFELTDFFQSYNPRGEMRSLFHRSRMDESAASPLYYLYLNDQGGYIIQKITYTAGVAVVEYYGKKTVTDLDADWADRANLTYVEYNAIFEGP